MRSFLENFVSRLSFMVVFIFMDLGEVGEIGKGSKSGGLLVVSKFFSKIRKGL